MLLLLAYISTCVPERVSRLHPAGAYGSTYTSKYQPGCSSYKISVKNLEGVDRGICQVLLDGNPLSDSLISLVENSHPHELRDVMG
jgi:hypothetical protein